MIRADLAREELVKELETLRQRVAKLEGRELEQRYQAVFESANDVILLIDKNGKIIDVNQRLTEISGYKIDELIGKDFRSLSRIVSEKSLAIITDNFTKRIASGVVLPYEVEMMKKNGELVFLEISARPLRNGGKIIGDLVTLRDVTERKEAEKQKGLSLRVLQLLNQSVDKRELIHDLLYLFKEHGQFEAVGIRLRDGDDYPYYASNGFPDKHIAENRLCASDNDSKLLRNNQNDLKLECMCSNIIYGRFDPFKSFITKGGSFWTNSTTDLLASTTEADRQARTCNRCNAEGYESVALIPLKANNVTIGLLQINDTRRNCFTQELVRYYEGLAQSIGIALAQEEIEEALQASETKYRDLYKNAPAAYFSVGIDGLIKETNRAAQLLFGYSEEELIGKPRLELYAPDCAVKAQAVFEQLKVGISLFDEEMIYKKKDGVIVYGLLSTTYTKDVNGHVDTIRSVIKDITERKQAETTIRESQKRFMELAEMLPMSIFEIDDKGKYTYLNREAYKIWKSTKTIPEESLGNNALVAFIPEDGDRITRDVTSIFMGENIGHQEYTALRGDGTTFPVLIKMAPIIHENKIVGVRGIVIDITERKQAEEKLKQAAQEWRTTFDSITDLISIHDKDNRIIRVNKAVADMLKTTPNELIGKYCHEVMHGTKEPPANCPHLQTLKTGKPTAI